MTRRLLLAAAGAIWIGALFLPWTARGMLSAATLLDAVRLVRRGAVDSVLPPAAATGLLVPALAGIALIALAGFAGRGTTIARAAAATIGSLVTLGLALRLTDADPARVGPGAWLGLTGVVLALAVGLVAVLPRDRA